MKPKQDKVVKEKKYPILIKKYKNRSSYSVKSIGELSSFLKLNDVTIIKLDNILYKVQKINL